MLARWLAKLQAYDFTIDHRPGLQHGNPDGLSRCGKCKNPARNSTLYRKAKRRQTGQTFYQLVVPLALRSIIIEQLHNFRIVGHLGISRTLSRVQERFYWPNLATDVVRWCASCCDCAARKGKPPPKRMPLSPLPVGEPFERIALDILDTHIPTRRGNVYILVISDYFSKYTDAYPLRRKTAYNCAKALAERWVAYHGVPTVIHSDQGREFEGHVFQRLTELLGATKTRTAPYRPQSDGLVERFNRTLLNMLSVFVCDRPTEWDEHLPYLLSAYRSSVHASTQCTPNSLVYGRETNLPIDLMIPGSHQSDIKAQNYPDYVQFVRTALQSAHTFARRHMGQALVRQKRGYDVHAKNRSSFKVGDLVRYYYVPIKNRNKFACPWIGPYKVINTMTEVDYRIQRLARPKDTRVVHIDHLKPFEKDYEPAMDDQGLPPLVLDEDYLDVVDHTARDEYREILEPLLDRESSVPVSTDTEPSVAMEAPGRSPAGLRRSSRHTRAPQRYGFTSDSVAHRSVR